MDLGIRIIKAVKARRHLTSQQLVDLLNKDSKEASVSADTVLKECEFLVQSKHLRSLPAAYTCAGLKGAVQE